MNPQSFKRLGCAIGAIILQVVFFDHLKVFGVQPDLILIFLLWYITKSTRTAAVVMGFFLGFAQDALLDLWGLNMFSKTLLAFLAHPWISKNMDNRQQLPRIITVVFIAALIHNFILLSLSFLIDNFSAEIIFWRYWIGGALYTSILATIIQLFRNN